MVMVLVPSASHLLTDHLLSSEGVFCYNLFRNLERFGYTFEAVSGRVHVNKPLKNARFHQTGLFGHSPTLNPVKKYIYHSNFIVRSYEKSIKIMKKQKIDIIHHILPAIYNQTFSLLALLGKTRRHPFILGPASAHIHQRPLDEKVTLSLTSKLHRKTVQRCDRLITITDQVKRIYTKFIDEEKIWTVPFGVDTELFKPREETQQKEQHEILFAGYLYKLKGTETLIKAMHTVSKEREDVRLRIVGDGPEKRRLTNLVQALKIEGRVTFEGFVPHNEMPKYYQRCDIFCFPTLGEPFGEAVIEAMACAKPVIASNIGGPAEIIKDGESGILIPPAQPETLAKRILELLGDEKTMKKIGRKAREVALRKYSWEVIAETQNKLYSSLI